MIVSDGNGSSDDKNKCNLFFFLSFTRSSRFEKSDIFRKKSREKLFLGAQPYLSVKGRIYDKN